MSELIPEREYLSISQVAIEMGVSDRTISNMIRRGELRAYRFGEKLIRIKRDDMRAILMPLYPDAFAGYGDGDE